MALKKREFTPESRNVDTYVICSGVSRFCLVARKPPPPAMMFLISEVTPLLAPTFTSHLDLRLMETPLRPTLDTPLMWYHMYSI